MRKTPKSSPAEADFLFEVDPEPAAEKTDVVWWGAFADSYFALAGSGAKRGAAYVAQHIN